MREWGFSKRSAKAILKVRDEDPRLFRKFMDTNPLPFEEWKEDFSKDDMWEWLKLMKIPYSREFDLRCVYCKTIPANQENLEEDDECPFCGEMEAMTPENDPVFDDEFNAMVEEEAERER